MANKRSDSFDKLDRNITRVGAHRGPKKRFQWVSKLVYTGVAFASITGGGWLALTLFDISVLQDITARAETHPRVEGQKPAYQVPVAEAVTDSEVPVTVLNGTGQAGLAGRVGAELSAAGWDVITTANASSSDVAESTVYYNNLGYEGYARGVAESMGIDRVEIATLFQGSPITAIIGSDYQSTN